MKSLLIVLSFVLASACTTTGKTQKNDPSLIGNSALVPAAEGQVTTTEDKNGNTQIKVQVKHLAHPERIAPGAENYVVWLKPAGAEAFRNIGAMEVNKNLEGSYDTKVPYKQFVLIVTPESTTTAQKPSGPTVLMKNVNI